MSVVINLTNCEIANRLLDDEYACWSRSAAFGIAEYLQELSDDIDEPIEFCHVAIRCDFSEYTWESLKSAYDNCCDFSDCDDTNDVIEVISDHTSIIWYDEETIVIQDF